MRTVKINLPGRSYDIHINSGLLSCTGELFSSLFQAKSKVLVISNAIVNSLYGDMVINSLKKAGFIVKVALMGDGEEYKTLSTALSLYDAVVSFGCHRDSIIVGLGGGIVGDVAGFVASTYMRGTYFVQIPTTLLAQVDSSVGGKVAVNHPSGKNLIGSFYQPNLVIADIATLDTLDEIEYSCGLAEVIKYGIIYDADFFRLLENNTCKLLSRDKEFLSHVIQRSCEIKAEVVQEDETEQNKRAILNYGHTFGHAFEGASNYTGYKHGEAVAVGMVLAARLAHQMGYIGTEVVRRIKELLDAVKLPTMPKETIPLDKIMMAMYSDKKVRGETLTFILPTDIGSVKIVRNVSDEQIHSVLEKAFSTNAE